MQEHHNQIANILLAVAIGTTAFWATALEETSWIASKVVPIVALAVGCLQLWFLLRKFYKRH